MNLQKFEIVQKTDPQNFRKIHIFDDIIIVDDSILIFENDHTCLQ